MKKVILKGFYGFGNLGDDILMFAMHQITKNLFPESEIFISSESKTPGYIQKILNNVKIVTPWDGIQVDWILHGGGGVFFDFSKGSKLYLLANLAIKFIGYSNYRLLYSAYKFLANRKRNRNKFSAGLGIGIGTYTDSSRRFMTDIISLSDFDILLVRDHLSLVNGKKYCSPASIHKFTDLAFALDFPQASMNSRLDQSKPIGFILRDWDHDNHVAILTEVAHNLQSSSHQIRFFSFDEKSDKQYIAAVAGLAPIHVWRPTEMSFDSYFNELAQCKLVVSSRAHGAIISACLGIPIICIGIEPKLDQVAIMLKHSAVHVRAPFNKTEISSIIKTTIDKLPLIAATTLEDAKRNKIEMQSGISFFKNRIDEIEYHR